MAVSRKEFIGLEMRSKMKKKERGMFSALKMSA